MQIYEELTLNAKNEFSTSFIHRDSHPKDNRLLARGWLSGEHLATRSPIVKQFLVATDPEGASVLADPDFGDDGGKGATGVDHIKYIIEPARRRRQVRRRREGHDVLPGDPAVLPRSAVQARARTGRRPGGSTTWPADW